MMGSGEEVCRRYFRCVQNNDGELRRIMLRVAAGDYPPVFELHDGILMIREPVAKYDHLLEVYDQRIRVVLPVSVFKEYALIIHVALGHAGVPAVHSRLSDTCYIEGMRSKLIRLLRPGNNPCHACFLTSKRGELPPRIGPISLPPVPFIEIGADLVGPCRRPSDPLLSDSSGWVLQAVVEAERNQKSPHILSMACRRTGYTAFELIPDARAETVAATFLRVLRRWGAEGYVQRIITDKGSQFPSHMFRAVALKLGGGRMDETVSHHEIPVGTPSHGGFYEVHHRAVTRTFKNMLAEDRMADYLEMTSVAAFKVNSHRPGGTAPSPFAQIHGFEPRLAAERLPLFAFMQRPPVADQRGVVDLADLLALRRAYYSKLFDDHFCDSRLAVAVRQRPALPPLKLVALGDLVLVRHPGRFGGKFWVSMNLTGKALLRLRRFLHQG